MSPVSCKLDGGVSNAVRSQATTGANLPAMSLPGHIVLRPNDFSQQDSDVVYKDPDGRELGVGRIFLDAMASGVTPWFWSVEFHQRRGRTEPHQGQADDLEAAKAAWRRCWDSANTSIHWPPSMRRGGSNG